MEVLWTEKYRPETFDQLDFHNEVNQKLINLVENGNMPHTIIYGPDGAGKRTRVNCLLSKLYGKGCLRVNKDTWSTKHNNTQIDLNIRYSKCHYELAPSDAEYNDRIVLIKLIKDTASNTSFYVNPTEKNSFMTFVLYDAHKLTLGAQAALRRTLEKYSNKIRVIMICETLGTLIPALKSRCLLLRVKSPSEGEINSVVEKIAKLENMKDYNKYQTNLLKASQRNMRKAMLFLQHIYLTKMPPNQAFKDYWKITIENAIIKPILQHQTVDTVKELRKPFYDLLVNQIPADEIIKEMLIQFCTHIKKPEFVSQAKEAGVTCDTGLKQGTRSIIYLESFAVKLMIIAKQKK